MATVSPRLTVLLAVLVVGAALVLGSGVVTSAERHLVDRVRTSSGGDLQATQALLKRYDATIAEASQVLTWRDNDPSLAQDASWQASSARVSQELLAEYRDALTMAPVATAGDVHACIAEALRLSSDGYDMLGVGAGQADGHHAYYLSAHGNWDLNLGTRKMSECKQLLASAGPGKQAIAGNGAFTELARARRLLRLVITRAGSAA